MAATIPVIVKIVFGQTIVDSRMEQVKIELAADGSDTVAQVKERIAVRTISVPDPPPSSGRLAGVEGAPWHRSRGLSAC